MATPFVKALVASFVLHASLMGGALYSVAWQPALSLDTTPNAPPAMVVQLASLPTSAVEDGRVEHAVAPMPEPVLASPPQPVAMPKAIPKPASTRPRQMAPAKEHLSSAVQLTPAPVAVDAHGGRHAYEAVLMAHIARYRDYPPRALAQRLQGTGVVHFRLDAHGTLINAHLVESTGHALLDTAMMRAIEKASPYPAPPDGAEEFTLPVRFVVGGVK